ncbi:MAG TPA: O-antigen ligase family protein [Bryobacteraceae bacterium]|nr:O-antigen ligase family protein [Bryobacteraceae bacterium]
MAVLVAAIIGMIALAIAPKYWFYFDVTPKVVVLLGGTAIALIAGGGRFRLRSRFSWLLFGSAASLVLSAAFSTNRALSWFGGNWRRFGVVEQSAILLLAWLVALHAAGRPNRVRIILRGVAAAALAAGIYGILQYFGRDPLLPAAAYHVGEGIWAIVRPPGTLGYVSYFANWLAMAAFLSLALAQMEERPLLRYGASAAAAAATCAMVLTGTRGALLASVAGCAALVFGRAWHPTRRSLTVAAVLGVAAIAFYVSPAGWNLHSRVRWFREDPRGGARLELWRDSLAMSIHRLPTGFGPEVFTAQFPHYESKQLAESYPDFAHESPHNMFLDALVSGGFPGLAILAALCALALARAPSAWLRSALVTGIVAQQFTVFTIPTAVMFYVAMALCAGEVEQSLPMGARYRAQRLAAACAACILLYFAFRFAAADRSLELARRSIQQNSGMAAAQFYSAFERWRLPGAGSDLWYSRAMAVLAQRAPNKLQRIQIAAQAGYAALRATRTAEDPFNAWYNAAALYASANDTVYAERSLRAAIAAHPNWFKPHWMLARVLLLEGRSEEARREAEHAVELDAGKHKEVAETLQYNATRLSAKQK